MIGAILCTLALSSQVAWAPIRFPGGAATSIALSRTGDWFAVGFDDGTIRVLDSKSGIAKQILHPSSFRIVRIVLSPNDDTFVVICSKGSHFEQASPGLPQRAHSSRGLIEPVSGHFPQMVPDWSWAAMTA